MKITFIATVFNEEKTIELLIQSLLAQSRKPDEIIIVDGGSTDRTKDIIQKYKEIRLFVKKGNRSVGRNEAIRHATGDIIVCSDAGCILDRNWVKNISKPLQKSGVSVVAGYYKGIPKTIFQKCLIPYVLVMEERVNEDTFLPASRSMAFTKKIWQQIGGFPEQYAHNEDYVFAKKLRDQKVPIVFQKDAIVQWIPRNTLLEAYTMFYRFAQGDAEARIFRSKVLFIFLRYIVGISFFFYAMVMRELVFFWIIAFLGGGYIVWSIMKNYRYVQHWQGIFMLPALQITADIAVLFGTILGYSKSISHEKRFNFFKKNYSTLIIILIFFTLMISIITWGIPNKNHPYNYHMDEWHQFMAIKSLFQHGTPNIEGAAHGTILQFFLSGLYLLPFIFLNVISLQTLRESLFEQEKLFIILRFNTLILGIFSLVVLSKITREYLKSSVVLALLLFTFTPIWLTLSNYYKYDIALIFWMLITIYMMMQYIHNPSPKNYLIVGLSVGLSFATKISAVPFMPLYIILFFLYNDKKRENIAHYF